MVATAMLACSSGHVFFSCFFLFDDREHNHYCSCCSAPSGIALMLDKDNPPFSKSINHKASSNLTRGQKVRDQLKLAM